MREDEYIRKQLDANLVPNGVRIIRHIHKKNAKAGPYILTAGTLVSASLICAGIMFAAGKLFGLPKSPALLAALTAVSFLLGLYTVQAMRPTKAADTDSFGNIIDKSNIYGSGRMMTPEEKRTFLEIFPERSPKGTILGTDIITGMGLGIPDENRPYRQSLDHRHILLTGASGRGKTKFLKDRLRQAIYQRFSVVYLDPKGEMTEDEVYPDAVTMEYKNKWTIRFRVKDIHLSNRFDLIKSIRTALYPEVEAGWLAGKVLGYKESADEKNYWEDSLKSLLMLSLIAAARCDDYISIDTYYSMEESEVDGSGIERGTWKTAVKVFEYTAEQVESYFMYLKSLSDKNEKLLRKHFNNWRGDERNWRSHVSSLQKKLSILSQEGVADIFSEDEIDFDRLVTEPSFLGLIYDVPPESFSPAMNLVLQLVSAAILRNKPKHRTVLILEELKITGVIDYLDDYFSFLRGYGTQIIGCTQSYPQLKKLYGEDEANSFYQNTHAVFMGGQEPETLRKLEELTGTQGLVEKHYTTAVAGGSVRRNESESVVQSAVVSKTSLLYLPKGKIFVKLSNCGPLIVNSYDSSKHPLAGNCFIEKATGKPVHLTLKQLVPGFDPEKEGLTTLRHIEAVRDRKDREYEEDHYKVAE